MAIVSDRNDLRRVRDRPKMAKLVINFVNVSILREFARKRADWPATRNIYKKMLIFFALRTA
jgi:hypothetical protein